MNNVAFGAFLGDKAFDANKARELLASKKIAAVNPPREGTKGGGGCARENYKWRQLVENFFCKIKAFRRIASRYEKTGACFAATIYEVNIVIAAI